MFRCITVIYLFIQSNGPTAIYHFISSVLWSSGAWIKPFVGLPREPGLCFKEISYHHHPARGSWRDSLGFDQNEYHSSPVICWVFKQYKKRCHVVGYRVGYRLTAYSCEFCLKLGKFWGILTHALTYKVVSVRFDENIELKCYIIEVNQVLYSTYLSA